MNWRLIFFDFEVKQDWWCVTFLEKDKYTTITDKLELINYIVKNKSDSIFIGYNNAHFDNYCLKAIWYGINPYKVVHHTIKIGYPVYDREHPLEELRFKKNIDIYTFDLMKSIGVMAPSLKEIEGNLGLAIITDKTIENDKECGLTDEEKQKLIEYNKHDVYTTMKLYEKIGFELRAILKLIDFYKLPMSTLNKSKASLLETIYKDHVKPQLNPKYFRYKTPEFIKFYDNQVKDAIENFEFKEDNKFTYDYEFDGETYKIGRGGAHYAKKHKYIKLKNGKILICADFGSFYPNMMANKTNEQLRLIDTVLPWTLLRKMIDLRMEEKKNKTELAECLKLPINGAFGKLIDKYSKLHYWPAGLSVCLTGQLITIMIVQELQNKHIGELENVNTDGFYYLVNGETEYNKFIEIMKKFELTTGINFSYQIIKNGIFSQKDVNNYIIADFDTNKIKVKGNMVNRYGKERDWYQYSQAVVDEAIVNKLVYNKPISKTILEAFNNNESRKFQILYNMKGKNWEGCYYGDTKIQKINRAFAVADKNKPDIRRMKNGTKCRFEDRPDHVIIYNNDLKDFDIRKIGLDLEWYNKLAQKRVEAFLGE